MIRALSSPFTLLAVIILAIMTLIALPGCEVNHVAKANKISAQTTVDADKVNQLVNAAIVETKDIYQQTLVALEQLNNPAPTVAALHNIQNDSRIATTQLSKVAPVTADIKVLAPKAAAETQAEAKEVAKVKSTIGYRIEVGIKWFLGIGVGFGILFGVIAFIAQLSGSGPIIGVAGDVLGAVVKGATSVVGWFGSGTATAIKKYSSIVWPWIKTAGKAVFHVATLGFAWIGSKLGAAVAAKKAQVPVPPSRP